MHQLIARVQTARFEARDRTSPSRSRFTRLPLLTASLVWVLAGGTAFGIAAQPLSPSLTPGDLVAALLGPGVTVGTVSYTGANGAAGAFAGGTGSVGFDSGIILSSGSVVAVAGPNNSDGESTGQGQPGDADLNALISGSTFDASILEFDFVPSGPELTFRYVFASEEYNEFVGSFNDVFGFFINGLNYALLPDAVTVVSINNINNGANPSFYIDNDCSDGPCPLDLEADGLTVVLTLTAPVTPDMTNSIKLAVADASDSALDSWVLIEAGSFTLGENCENGIDDDGDALVDGDDPDCHVCGDGDLDPGEQCDDGNIADGDGCSALCQSESGACGDGTVDAGENCDDGNLLDGDCCSSTCQYEASGSPCSDADACNGGETCDGAGVCLDATPLDCDDGNLCTQDSCDPDSGCVNAEEPASLCRTAGSSQLLLKQKGGAKDKLVWKWIKGEATSPQDFADPTGGAAYSLCIYAGPANALVAQADVPAGGNWKPLSNKGYKYFDAGLGADGIQKVLLKSGTAGKAKALVKGKGGGLPDPMLGLALPVTAQLVKGGATPLCVGSTYGTAIKNETGQFMAKQQP